jgi:hypothetical protein
MKKNAKSFYWILALLAAISFDLMFWKKPGGINFFIFTTVAVLGILIPLWLEKVQIPWTSTLIPVPAGFFSLMTFIRAEPLTNLINGLIVAGTLIVFTVTLRNGTWPELNLQDYIAQFLKFFLNSIIGGVLYFIQAKKDKTAGSPAGQTTDAGPPASTETGKRKIKVSPFVRGILLALPILFILTLLLASADPVFANRITGLFDWLSFDNLAEFLFRLTYVVIIAYVLLSAYYYGSTLSAKWEKGHHTKPVLQPFLGTIESSVVLGAVCLLFLAFVIIQFTYLFGGQENISVEGFTYAEYARRGFFELLAVALISLVLFYGLSLWTKRETKSQRVTFSGLGLLLMALVCVILLSAFTRLSLYEAAYGFTRLRTLTHIFTVWTGLVLVVTVVLEVSRKLDKLAFFLILLICCFGLTVNFFNIDQFIVQQNITRALEIEDTSAHETLDAGYLTTLSNDAIPQLAAYFNDPVIPETIHDNLGAVLACRLAILDETDRTPLTSWHFSREKAIQLLNDQEALKNRYPVETDNGWLYVDLDGHRFSCDGYDWMD